MSGRRIELKPGDRFLNGEYQLEVKLGEGGMGQVWAAIEIYSGNFVAIKLMHAQDGNFVARFRQECRFYTELRHANIVGMLKAGEDENGVMYIMMALLRGKTLRKVLQSAQLDVEHALHLAVQIADAVAYMHRKRVWHRDLKPENMMVGTHEDEKGHLWIVDFGIARFADTRDQSFDSAKLTEVGTTWYMAPEQVDPANRPNVDHRADVYAFGAIVYEMIAKRHLFVPKGALVTPAQVMYGHLHAAIKPLPEIVAGCSDDLWELVRSCIARDPRDRLDSLAKAATAIRSMIRPSALPSNPYLARQVKKDILHAARAEAFSGVGLEDDPREDAADAPAAAEPDPHRRTTVPGRYPDQALEAAIQRAKIRSKAAKEEPALPEDEAEDTDVDPDGEALRTARPTEPMPAAFAPPEHVLPFAEAAAPPKLGKGHTMQMPSAPPPLAPAERAADAAAAVPFRPARIAPTWNDVDHTAIAAALAATAPATDRAPPVSPYADTEPRPGTEAAPPGISGTPSKRFPSAATLLAAQGISLDDARASAKALPPASPARPQTPLTFSPLTPVATMTMQRPLIPPVPTYPGVAPRSAARTSPLRTYDRAVAAGVVLAAAVVGTLLVARRWTGIVAVFTATTAQAVSPSAEPAPSSLPAVTASAAAQVSTAPQIASAAPSATSSAQAAASAAPPATASSPAPVRTAPAPATGKRPAPPAPKPKGKRLIFETEN